MGVNVPSARGAEWKALDVRESMRKYQENYDRIFGRNGIADNVDSVMKMCDNKEIGNVTKI